MGYGSFVLMLHSHLPYYRKAGMWPFGEENLYECMAETYLPLLNALSELLDEGIKAGITIGLTPILVEQLADPYLQHGFVQYLESRLTAVREDIARYPDPSVPHSEHLAFLAQHYEKWFSKLLDDFTLKYDYNLVKGFKALQDAGAIEIVTSGATHGFSPLLGQDASVNAQFKVGVESYKRHFGVTPSGSWLPECAYRPAKEAFDPVTGEYIVRPSVDAFLFQNGLQYFFTEYHAIEGGISSGARRMVGLYGNIKYIPLPARQKTGLTTYEAYWMKDYPVAVMGRNDRASFQVWSAAHGYPGDGLYREFHKKDERSGMHYWRITGKDADLGDKMLYDPVQAFNHTQMQADHFVTLVYHMLKDRYEETGEKHLIMVSFDTELFGHWWFEGVTWLKRIIRGFHQCKDVAVETGSQYLQNNPPKQAISLPESTWGQGGHYWVWQNHHTDWMWPIIHAAERKMRELVDRYANEADPLRVRTLNQAFRELLLLESSDWPFLVTTFQAKDYAIERFLEHKENFWTLAHMLEDHHMNEGVLSTLEEKNNPFPDIDYRWYQYESQAEPVLQAV